MARAQRVSNCGHVRLIEDHQYAAARELLAWIGSMPDGMVRRTGDPGSGTASGCIVTPEPQISIIVPTLNEAANLASLAEQIDAALSERSYEVVIVDDGSRDGTAEVCERLSVRYPVRLIVRAAPTDGLSGAVLHGIAQARGEILVVMDADLQHPPSALPALIDPIARGEADFVLGSRYAPGGSTGEHWTLWRRLNSRLAVLLARPLTGPVHDPMSGFFVLRRGTFARGRRLTPLGYKIGLELIAKCRVEPVVEVPIRFGVRTRGASKLTTRERFRYLEHLSRLYDYAFPRASRMLKFLIVTLLSWTAGGAVFAALVGGGLLAPPWATSIAYLAAIAVTAIFHARYVRTQRAFLVRPRPWRDFLLSAAVEWTGCTALAAYLTARLDGPRAPELFLLPFAAALLVRYVLPTPPSVAAPPPPQ